MHTTISTGAADSMTAIFKKNLSRFLRFHIVANFVLKNISTERILNNSGFCHHKLNRSKNWKRSKTDFTKHHLTFFFVAFTLYTYSHSQIIGYLTLARVWFWSKNLPSSSICCFIVQWRSIGGKKKKCFGFCQRQMCSTCHLASLQMICQHGMHCNASSTEDGQATVLIIIKVVL